MQMMMIKIQQEQIKVPDSYFKRINLTLQNLPEKTTRYHLKYAAAVAAGLCLMISGAVYDAANYVQQRMLSMDETKKKEMIDYTIHSVKDIDTYSRELTAVEKERMETLLYEYQVQGKFPENGLEIVFLFLFLFQKTDDLDLHFSKQYMTQCLLTDYEMV